VLNRVDQLADREEGFIPDNSIPYKNVIPLMEIIAEALNTGKGTQKTLNEYVYITTQVGNEFEVLLEFSKEELNKKINPKVVEGILKVRSGEVDIFPGYDGEYGKISVIWDKKEEVSQSNTKQLELF
jgi:PHP family Zn ribbon phosphoesterase